MRMSGDGDRRGRGPVHALSGQGTPGRDLGEQHTGHRHCGRRQVLVRGDRVFGRQRAHPLQRLEPDRTHHNQLFAHRLEQQLRFPDQRGDISLDPRRGHQFFEGFQPGAALAAERDSVRLAGRETVDQSMGVPRKRAVPPVRAFTVGGEPVLLVDRHLVYLPVCVFMSRIARPVASPGGGPTGSGTIPL